MIQINSFTLTIFLIAGCLLPLACNAFRVQSVAINGALKCADTPAANVLVKLFDKDDGPDPDDLLDTTYTSANGSFWLSGDTMELTDIDPQIRIYHECGMHLPMCKREWVITIPDKYISSGRHPKSVMQLGEVNLEIELENEDRHDCFH